MTQTDASGLRAELVAALEANTARLCDALQVELARPIRLDSGRRLQFEVDPWSWGIHSCATEEPVASDDWLPESLPGDWFDRADEAEVNPDALIADELCPWFARCWRQIGGPARFSPAFLFFHGFHQQQFDLEQNRWVTAAVAFGSSPDVAPVAAPDRGGI